MLTIQRFTQSNINEWLTAMRQQGDAPADAFISLLFEDSPRQALPALHQWASEKNTPLPLMLYPEHPFWLHYQQMPDWADKQQLQTGRAFFRQYAEDIMLLLGFLSLPYCYAAADGAKVLYRTRRIAEDTRRRLAETAQFVLAVHTDDIFDLTQAQMPQAMRTVVTVRLMHAAVRYHIRRSGKWNDEQLGVPVNQEDMAGTNLAFSFIIIQGLRKTGHAIAHEQAAAFIHLWNVIGHFLGVQEQLLPADERVAARLDRAIAQRQFRPSPEGTALTRALIESIEENVTASPLMQVKGFVPAYMRFLLGDSIANLLRISAAGVPSSLFGIFQLKNLRPASASNSAADFQNILQRTYGKLTYRLPERLS
ncbi:oxygenase MpaB family protein [Rhodoflexus caldus]|uniref:oxygenase MpaB family protein n=1 Tax=Rhodoflexus caldus TaxID=2891236 RepID=UPI00202A11D8|nr:oxygenase MpaB family protein [Rhodoflexus caldus]